MKVDLKWLLTDNVRPLVIKFHKAYISNLSSDRVSTSQKINYAYVSEETSTTSGSERTTPETLPVNITMCSNKTGISYFTIHRVDIVITKQIALLVFDKTLHVLGSL